VGLAYDRPVAVRVRFRPSGRALFVAPGTSLLEAARRAGLPMASGCGAEGLCGRCGLRVLSGAEHLSPETDGEAEAKRRNRVDDGLRLACQATVAGDVEVSTSYW
jgi:ferredoxin